MNDVFRSVELGPVFENLRATETLLLLKKQSLFLKQPNCADLTLYVLSCLMTS